MSDDRCGCLDCLDREDGGCFCDCDVESPCLGCRDSREYAADILFSIDLAQGRF